MIAVCLLFILTTIRAEVLESTENTQQNQNVTTLYPVTNKTDLYTTIASSKNESEHRTVKEKSKTDATTWKLEAAYAETNLDKEKDGNTTKVEEEAREAKNNDSKEFKPSQPLGSFFDEEALAPRGTESYEPYTQVFKHPASSFVSFPKGEYYATNEKAPKEEPHRTGQKHTTEFPYEFEKAINTRVQETWPDLLESKPTVEVPVKVPCIYGNPDVHNVHESSEAHGSTRVPEDSGAHEDHEVYEIPGISGAHVFHGLPGFHSAVHAAHGAYETPNVHQPHVFHEYPGNHGSHVIHEVPYDSRGPEIHAVSDVRIPLFHGSSEAHKSHGVSGMPAGGLYKLTDPFKPEAGNINTGEYSWELNGDVAGNHIKKRVNPLQSLLRLITAFLPVGLIISALTPNIITIHNTENAHQPSIPYRRSDQGVADIAPISERCRRRLLCELHSDANYGSPPHKRKRKHCYKIYCEDTQALWRLLQWLLARHKSEIEDHRARDST